MTARVWCSCLELRVRARGMRPATRSKFPRSAELFWPANSGKEGVLLHGSITTGAALLPSAETGLDFNRSRPNETGAAGFLKFLALRVLAMVMEPTFSKIDGLLIEHRTYNCLFSLNT